MFFTDNLHLAYRSYYSKKMEATRLPIPLQEMLLLRYFNRNKSGFYDLVKTCSDIAGIVDKFENQKIVSL